MFWPFSTEDAGIKTIRKAGEQESRKKGAGELATKGLRVGDHSCGRRSFGVERTPSYLLVRDCRARWAGKMDDFEALEADFATPFFEIGGRIIERVAEFDQHV
jgi:hypothetical protein